MKIAIEPILDRYGWMYPYISGIKKFSSHKVREVPSRFTRIFLNRSEWIRQQYERFVEKNSLKGYDVIHSMSLPRLINLCLLSRSASCKWVHTYHILFFEEDYMEGLQEWQKETNRALIEVASKADVKISTSKWFHDYLLDKYSIQTVIIEYGVDLKTCDKAKSERFVNKYGLHNFVLFVGSIREVKNPELFIKLAARIPELRFVMIGPDLEQSKLRKKYGISIPRNLILMGKMEHRDVLDAMSACKVYVVTSKSEGGPYTLLEAMAMSKPVVVPSHTGCKEIVQNNDYGFLYEPNSLDDLVAKTRQALLSDDYIGQKARERVLQEFDWKIIAKKIDSLYESCR